MLDAVGENISRRLPGFVFGGPKSRDFNSFGIGYDAVAVADIEIETRH
jgi:hypothetical protein